MFNMDKDIIALITLLLGIDAISAWRLPAEQYAHDNLIFDIVLLVVFIAWLIYLYVIDRD